MKRKWSIIVVVTLIAFLVGALLAHLFLLPRLVQRQAVSMAKKRGILLDTGKVSMLGTSFRFQDVVICSVDCGAEDPLVVAIDHLKVTPDLLSILAGAPRPSGVTVTGAHVRLDLTHPDALDFLRASSAGGAGDEVVDGSGSERGGRGLFDGLPKIMVSNIKVEVTMKPGSHLRFDDASILVDGQGGAPTIDLGATVLTSPQMNIESRQLMVDLSGPGEPGPIRALRFVGPVIVLDASLMEKVDRSELPGGPPADPGGEGTNPVLAVLALIESAVSMTSIPDELLGVFPKPRIEVNDGSVHVPSTDSSPAVDASGIRGDLTLDVPGSSLSMNVVGNVDQGPFTLAITVDDEKVLVVADTPYVPIGLLASRLPVPSSLRAEEARFMLDAEVLLDRSTGALRIDGTMAGDSMTIVSDRLALEPVENVHFRIDGLVELDPEAKTVVLTDSVIDACGIPLYISAGRMARLDDGYRITLRGNMPNTRCQELFNALPFAMRSSLPGFQLDGDLGAQFDLDMDWNNPDDALLDVNVDNKCSVVSGGELKLSKFSGTFVHNVKDKVGEHAFVMGPGSDNWSNLEEIVEYMPHALVTCEDGAFYKHKGISPFAIKRAVKRNIKKGYFALGASTITMQLVKNLLLTRDKTISRKLQEMILTWWIENNLQKDQIIELYLNVVEYGPALYGIKAAAQHYFGKLPSDLSLLESAHLAKMLPNPVARYRYYKDGRDGVDPKWIAVLQRVVTKMYERNFITSQQWEEAMADDFHFYYPDTQYVPLPSPAGESESGSASESAVIPSLPEAIYVPATSPFPDFSAD